VLPRFFSVSLTAVLLIALAGCSGHSAKPQSASTTSPPAPSSDLLTEVRQRHTLIIATDANYSPQSVLSPDGTWSGFDVEVGREIAKRLGVRPLFKPANFDVVAQGHWLGKWDVDIGSMSITGERTKVLWFTKSYYWVPGSIAVNSSSGVKSFADLAGKKVGVAAATTFQSYLAGKLTGKVKLTQLHLQAVPYDTDVHALRDLSQGRKIDAVLTSLPTIETAIKAGENIRFVDGPVYEDRAAIALDRGSYRESLALLFAIDGILDAMHRDGTLKRLSVKYYGMDLSNG
jgi:polar amino acid transport system substrate-binding protein